MFRRRFIFVIFSDLDELQGKCINLLLSALKIKSKVVEISDHIFSISDLACLVGANKTASSA